MVYNSIWFDYILGWKEIEPLDSMAQYPSVHTRPIDTLQVATTQTHKSKSTIFIRFGEVSSFT